MRPQKKVKTLRAAPALEVRDSRPVSAIIDDVMEVCATISKRNGAKKKTYGGIGGLKVVKEY
jgi:hypothetical protein